MPVKLNGSTSGYVELTAPAVAGATTLTLPATTGTLVVANGGQTLEFAAGSNTSPSITATGDTNTGFFFPAADNAAISTGGSERFRVGSSGQLGVAGANYGTSGQVLTSGGASAAPSWTTVQGVAATTGSAPYYGARAWVNFNGQGTLAIKASVNISSITDNGVGDYTVNFTTAMPDENWAASAFSVAYATNDTRSGLVAYQPTGTATFIPLTKTTSAARIINGRTSGVAMDDSSDISFIVYR